MIVLPLLGMHVIEGTDASGSTMELPVVAGGKASITSITSLRYGNATSAICTTRVPINMFDYERADAKITIKGTKAQFYLIIYLNVSVLKYLSPNLVLRMK